MAKVDIDSTNLTNGFIVYINDAISEINKVLRYFDNFSVPYDFSRRSELNSVENTFREIKSQLENIKSWVVDSNNDFNKVISAIKDYNEMLPQYTIRQRTTII